MDHIETQSVRWPRAFCGVEIVQSSRDGDVVLYILHPGLLGAWQHTCHGTFGEDRLGCKMYQAVGDAA